MKRLKNLKVVLAVANDGIIGINNDLPWKMGTQKADMKRFRELTKDNIVVMGSKTFESMGSKPLPKRMNIVLTTKPQKDYDNVSFINALELDWFLSDLCEVNPTKEVFIIGGADVIKQTIHLVSKVHLSFIDIKPSYNDHDDVVQLDTLELLKDFSTCYAENFQSDTENGNIHSYTFVDYRAND